MPRYEQKSTRIWAIQTTTLFKWRRIIYLLLCTMTVFQDLSNLNITNSFWRDINHGFHTQKKISLQSSVDAITSGLQTGARKRLHWFKFWRNFSAAKHHKFSDQLLIFFSLIYNFLLFSLYSSCSWAGLFKARLGYTKITANFDFTLATFSGWPNRNRSFHLTWDRNFWKFWHYGKHLVSPGKLFDWKSMTNSIENFCVLLMIKEHNFTSLKTIKCVNITSIDKTINLYHAEARNISWYPCSGGQS